MPRCEIILASDKFLSFSPINGPTCIRSHAEIVQSIVLHIVCLVKSVVLGTAAAKMLSSDAKRSSTAYRRACRWSTVVVVVVALHCNRVRLPAVLLMLLLLALTSS